MSAIATAEPVDELVFPAIEDCAAIGNLETVALVANTGTIEFFSYPNFDSPTVFAALLDRKAGHFVVAPEDLPAGRQRYHDDTNVLVTRFETPDGVLEVTDFMPVGGEDAQNQLVRIARCREGRVKLVARCKPSFNYGHGRTVARRTSSRSVVFEDGTDNLPLRLAADRPLTLEDGVAGLDATLTAGEAVIFNLVCDNFGEDLVSCGKVEAALAATLDWWRSWVGLSSYKGRWRERVMRSALALKLMFSETHGSIVAAPTFGLPEAIGGERNWDYRYCWVRDSAFTVYAMLSLGFTEEAANYRKWMRARFAEDDHGRLQLMYRLDGTTDGLEERELSYLSGYRGSVPVRVGNAAHTQTQLDIYGEVVDTLYLAHRHLGGTTEETFEILARVIDHVCATWEEPGSGLWEMRGAPQHFLDGRLLSWVAVDRALRLCEQTGLTPRPYWHDTLERIRTSLETEFFNPRIGAFTQVKGGSLVDSVALLIPLVRFLPPTDPRVISTLKVIEERLVTGPFVRRYQKVHVSVEGVDGPPEGAFVACSFWYIENLARAGRVGEAAGLFEEMLAYASPTGLYAEEIAPDGSHLGNSPQALSHLAMISAAVALDEAIEFGGQPF
ncbi:glycoside hydrolase family 15 protein [Acuticoccus mangrovi]|uniref:Glycoside hydrolase family 15 protein n=1 Tax=Acuticoccus mangrovi TaxID=2796142 RepID=A0A934IMJ7_9HYPH|nr:glycoside hydrolase family 15 protein [Acuticoccus mangrovi]MBJ3774982.1 glycoside hydrolase family 15 protein [Acuticoccus mangrovi]